MKIKLWDYFFLHFFGLFNKIKLNICNSNGMCWIEIVAPKIRFHQSADILYPPEYQLMWRRCLSALQRALTSTPIPTPPRRLTPNPISEPIRHYPFEWTQMRWEEINFYAVLMFNVLWKLWCCCKWVWVRNDDVIQFNENKEENE